MKNFTAFRNTLRNYDPEELMEGDFGDLGGEERIYSGGSRFDDGYVPRGGKKSNRHKRTQKRGFYED